MTVFPPGVEVRFVTRDLATAGHFLQRELIDYGKFAQMATNRGIRTASGREQWEAWDRDGVLSPVAFYIGLRPSQDQVGTYPVDEPTRDETTGQWATAGYVFRDEHGFEPWDRYEYEPHDDFSTVQPLYSEWQLLALPLIHEHDYTSVPVSVLAGSDGELIKWASGIRRDMATTALTMRGRFVELWAPLITTLIRLQSRYWPWISGKDRVLFALNAQEGDRPSVGALELELRRCTAAETRDELGLSNEDVRLLYRWLCYRLFHGPDELLHLRDLLRLLPRRSQVRARGRALQALDVYDACEVLRRFYQELTGTLLPAPDQSYGDDIDYAAQPLNKNAHALSTALAHHGLTAHKLHVVVEGDTEARLVTELFRELTGRELDSAGIALTDLEGDKLAQSGRFIESFGIYAREVALLLDDENDARKIAERMVADGIVKEESVTFAPTSLEEDNFTPNELVAMANELGAARGVQLGFTGDDLTQALEKRNSRPGVPPMGMARMLQKLARNPQLGPVLEFAKPDLAGPMMRLIVKEIEADGFDATAQRRPILDWMRRFPLRVLYGH